MDGMLPAGTGDVLSVFLGSPAVLYGVVAVAAYFLGYFNGAVLVSRYILHNDVRGHGSGNAGLTNFYRVFGGRLTLVVLLCDMLKAVLAVMLGAWLFAFLDAALFGKYWAAVFCLLGHMYPCMFGFKGGKGILSGGAIALTLDWRVALIVWGLFLVSVVLTRYVSLGSCLAGAGFPIATWLIYREGFPTACGTLLGVLILWKHRGNIQRLLAGEENRFSLHKRKEKP